MSDFASPTMGDFVGNFEFSAPERKAPTWPIYVGIAFLLVSIALAVVGFTLEGVPLLTVGLLGYLLTPLGTAFLLILAMRSHRTLSAVDGYVADSGTRLTKWCALVAGLGFVVAVPHIWQIADYFALLFAPGA